MVSTYQLVVEERRDQTSGIQGSWEGRNVAWEKQQESRGSSAARAVGQSDAVGVMQSPQVLSDSAEIASLEVQIMLENKRLAASARGDIDTAKQFQLQIDALKAVVSKFDMLANAPVSDHLSFYEMSSQRVFREMSKTSNSSESI